MTISNRVYSNRGVERWLNFALKGGIIPFADGNFKDNFFICSS